MLVLLLHKLCCFLCTAYVCTFWSRGKEKIFQVYVSQDRNFLAPEHHLLELFFRAKDIDAVQPMLALFKERFHYPKYHEPCDIGWIGKQIFIFTPRAHNVIWREELPSGEHCFRSCNIADLHEFAFKSKHPK